MIPSSLLHFQFNGFRLWLPIFLLWPIVLLVALLVGLLLLKPGRTLRETYAFLCGLRGMEVNVQQPENSIQIAII